MCKIPRRVMRSEHYEILIQSVSQDFNAILDHFSRGLQHMTIRSLPFVIVPCFEEFPTVL